MNGFHTLTVGVITKNAAVDLPGLLESLPKEIELVVADGGSEDATIDLAKAAGATVVDQDQEAIHQADGNFDVARNVIDRVASRDWIVFLDADERLTPEGREEISEAIGRHSEVVAYDIPRINLFWGRSVRLLGDDRQLRLVQRHKGHWVGKKLHRGVKVDGQIGHLQHPFLHVNARSWRDLIARIKRDAAAEARSVDERPSLWRIVAEPLHHFRLYYRKNQAWRDGWRGLVVSMFYSANRASVLLARRRSNGA